MLTANPTSEGEAAKEDRRLLEQTVLADAVQAVKAITENPTPYDRRTAVRTVFTCIEGMTFFMRQYCLYLHDAGESSYSPAELALLREESYGLDDKGTETTSPARIGLQRLLPFSFAMHARHFDPTFVLDRSTDGWRQFCEALRIRNRVTHPRRGSELDISKGELATVLSAFRWFIEQVMESRRMSKEKFERKLDVLKSTKRQLEELSVELESKNDFSAADGRPTRES
jgi:hypothetical protein